ncbi:endocuticle structural glycoprotein SgAbd-1-like [Artemia franciscana]|uniref:Cuticle protein n=1 Tax=Artemia franciscana TaxID=6661 RepID=A0AA88HMV9_ARTSF|nr:hypothetical protein QYM36_013580 [Artemia franciscana]
MKTFIVVACLLAVAYCRPQASEREAEVIEEESELNPEDGSYRFAYKTSNGITREESGQLKQITPEDAGTAQTGSWTYTAPDGSEVRFSFTADENGYQPSSDLLPVAPEMPAHVIKLLQSIARRAAA